MLLSDTMVKTLNEQIEMEGYASFLYLSMAGWFDAKSMQGCAAFMYRQSQEEHGHMMKIFKYLVDLDAMAIAPGIKQPPGDFASVQEIFADTLAHEQRVTNSIHEIVELAIKEKDHATYNFLQWYVNEQREEENLMRSILDKINLIGTGPQSLYFIDKEIAAINKEQVAAEKTETAE